MNRRKFFGMTAAALIGAGLPLSLLPERSIFLPPRQGWYPSDFVMRETIQFSLSVNRFIIRHDVMFHDHGKPLQNFIAGYLKDDAIRANELESVSFYDNTIRQVFGDGPFTFDETVLRCLRKEARNYLARTAFINGYDAPKVLLPLPYGVESARYV